MNVNPSALREITDESGGRTEVVKNSGELTAAAARIAEELNSQYMLGYSSPHPADQVSGSSTHPRPAHR